MKCLISEDKHFYIPVFFTDADLELTNEYKGKTTPMFRKIGKDVRVVERKGTKRIVYLRFKGCIPSSKEAMTSFFKNAANLPFVSEEPRDIVETRVAPNVDLREILIGGSEGQKMLAIYGTIAECNRFIEYD